MRGTGGNRFIAGDADLTDLMRAIHEGLHQLREWADDTGRHLDVGAITIDTKRIPSGRISVSVTGDLTGTPQVGHE